MYVRPTGEAHCSVIVGPKKLESGSRLTTVWRHKNSKRRGRHHCYYGCTQSHPCYSICYKRAGYYSENKSHGWQITDWSQFKLVYHPSLYDAPHGNAWPTLIYNGGILAYFVGTDALDPSILLPIYPLRTSFSLLPPLLCSPAGIDIHRGVK